MSNLKDLVPPFELCRKIPEGEFADSALAWIDHRDVYPEDNANPCVVVRSRSGAATSKKGVFPAPTLQEIMDILPQGIELNKDSEYFCSLDMRNEYYGETAVIAALKVWLKMKGIEHEQEQG